MTADPNKPISTSRRDGRMHGRVQRQQQLPFRKAVDIAWMNIRARIGRSLLVICGILLAIAFLTYIIVSDKMSRMVVVNATNLINELQRADAPRAQPDMPVNEIVATFDKLAKDEALPEASRDRALQMGAFVSQLWRDGKLGTLTSEDEKIQTRWMVGLALLVSFVGILNAMLLSVTERFSEIGTMKCLGALNRLIVELFLLESFFQGVVGTLAGILVGILLTLVEGLRTYGWQTWSLIDLGEMMGAVAIAGVAGVLLTIAGALYPAWRAARMQPVLAMRTEV
jgi:ABC-type antimicrobial peptide transport system permease subunit